MVVAFYSPFRGQSGNSSNLLAAAIVSVLQYQKRVFVMESHFEKNALSAMLLKGSEKRESGVLEDFGIDLLVRGRALTRIEEEQLHNASFSFLEDHLHLLSGTRQANWELFEELTEPVILEAVKAADLCHDLVFLDVDAGQDFLARQLLGLADRVVITLPQNPWLIRQHLEQIPKEQQKQIYVIGNYEPDSRFNRRNLSAMFPFLSGRKTVPITHDAAWMDALLDAAAISCLRRQAGETGRRRKPVLIRDAEKLCHLILSGEEAKLV